MRTLIRRNLCVDPRNTTVSQSYSASLPGIAVEEITDHPLGIKTANRITYVNNQSNPGIIYYVPFKQDTTYAFSAWVKHDADNGASVISWGHALSSIAGQNVGMSAEKGSWERITWVYSVGTAVSEGFGFRKITSSVGGSYLITGITVEESTSVGEFFDGSTLETFYLYNKWTGTPNNSTSEQYRIEVMENFNPQLALQDAKMKSLEAILGPSPVKTQNGSLTENQYAAMEKVLRDNALIV